LFVILPFGKDRKGLSANLRTTVLPYATLLLIYPIAGWDGSIGYSFFGILAFSIPSFGPG